MKNVRTEKTVNQNLKDLLRVASHRLLVDVIPVVLLLLAMAYGMVFVSLKLSEPRSVEIQVVAKKLG